jgi:hypothetical protein
MKAGSRGLYIAYCWSVVECESKGSQMRTSAIITEMMKVEEEGQR